MDLSISPTSKTQCLGFLHKPYSRNVLSFEINNEITFHSSGFLFLVNITFRNVAQSVKDYTSIQRVAESENRFYS